MDRALDDGNGMAMAWQLSMQWVKRSLFRTLLHFGTIFRTFLMLVEKTVVVIFAGSIFACLIAVSIACSEVETTAKYTDKKVN